MSCGLRVGFFRRVKKEARNVFFCEKSVLKHSRRFLGFSALWQNGSAMRQIKQRVFSGFSGLTPGTAMLGERDRFAAPKRSDGGPGRRVVRLAPRFQELQSIDQIPLAGATFWSTFPAMRRIWASQRSALPAHRPSTLSPDAKSAHAGRASSCKSLIFLIFADISYPLSSRRILSLAPAFPSALLCPRPL
jgi:hypothetical protein